MRINVQRMMSLDQKHLSVKHQVVAQMVSLEGRVFLTVTHLVTSLLIFLIMRSKEAKMLRFRLNYHSWKLSKAAEKPLRMKLILYVELAMEVVYLLELCLKHVKFVEVPV
uniref:Uncharacterized protein n=1 Tax=Arundo donax TaxID=35708 RepID=A0A0A9G9Z3_ARUDO